MSRPTRRSFGFITALAVASGLTIGGLSATAEPVGSTHGPSGSLLQPVASANQVTLRATFATRYCSRLQLPDHGVQDCGSASMVNGHAIWSYQTNSSTGMSVLVVFESSGYRRWTTKLMASAPSGDWASAKAVAADVDNDGAQELVVGIRRQSDGRELDLHVVDIRQATTKVTAYRSLFRGQARAQQGSIRVAEARYASGESECCPSLVEWNRLRYRNRAWTVTATAETTVDDAPLWVSQFD